VRQLVWIAGAGVLLGMLGAYRFLVKTRAEVSGGVPKEVFVLKEDVKAGTPLAPEALEVARVPESYVDPRRVPASELRALTGVPLVSSIRAGEGLYWSDLAGGQRAASALAELVQPGRRAFALSAEANPLGTFVAVGDRVDILCAGGGNARTVLERALVLSVGGRMAREEASKVVGRGQGMTLSLLPEEAETLLRAERGCRLRTVLRNPEDTLLRAVPADPKPVSAPRARKEIERVR
jgi:Flp pilus assembly protein CpaB